MRRPSYPTRKLIPEKLNFAVMSVLGSAMLVVFLFQLISATDLALEKTKTNLAIVSEITANHVAPSLLFNDATAAQSVVNSLNLHPDILQADIFDTQQQTFATYLRSAPASPWAKRLPAISLFTINRPIELHGEKLGHLLIVQDLGSTWSSLSTQCLLTLCVALLASLLCYASMRRLSRGLLSPIQRLAEAARYISSTQHYGLRVEKLSDDELGELTQAFNAMLEEIEHSDQLLRSVIDNIPSRVFWKDLNLQYLGCNRLFAQDAGANDPADIIGKHDQELAWNDQSSPDWIDEHAVIETGCAKLAHEQVIVTALGREIWLQTSKTPLTDSRGQVIGVLGIYDDISKRKQVAIKLQLAANVFTYAREGILITDAEGNILDVNDTFTSITGYSRDEALGQNPRILKSDRHSSEFFVGLWHSLLTKGHWSGELWNLRKNGEIYAELLTISSVKDATGKILNFVGLFSDITPMKNHQRQLEYIAHYDALTNLPNRVLLADRLNQAIIKSKRSHKSLAVVYLDLDGFKAVNDNHGHEVGDELLIVISRFMKDALRASDTLSRIGGDEFVAVLVDLVDSTACEPILERLLQAASRPVQIGQRMMQVSASIGVTFYPEDRGDADQLVRHADQAMYVAKQTGKNSYHLFDVDLDAAIKSTKATFDRICRALEADEFVLYYQPRVNMKTGQVLGAEALIRWQHPEQGLLPPANFLQALENHPKEIKLGEWVISKALRQISAWQKQGLDFTVSVNISAYHLQQDEFLPRLRVLLAAYPDVPAERLELEILETSALRDLAKISGLMQACKALGVRFALDDFGTGYSSLTYLKHLPAEVMKVDQSFVRGMLEDASDLSIVKGVVSLAQSFNREVVAEGVESLAHRQRLLEIGCENGQGFGIAKPMPAERIPLWLVDWRNDPDWQT